MTLNRNSLIEVLDWIKRTELAQSSWSTYSIAYRKLHGNVKPRIVKKLEFSHIFDVDGNSRSVLRKDDQTLIPIASIEPPKYIIGIGQIKFNFVDGQALKFVEAILPRLNNITISIDLTTQQNEFKDHPSIGPITRLMQMLAPKSNKLEIHRDIDNEYEGSHETGWDYKPKLGEIPKFIDGIQKIYIDGCTRDDMDGIFLDWLTIPAKNGHPKLFNIGNYYCVRCNFLLFNCPVCSWIGNLKKEFINALEPANFIIKINTMIMDMDYEDVIPIPIENALGEILEVLINDQNPDHHFIVRRPKNDGTKIADWEKQFNRDLGTITIFIP